MVIAVSGVAQTDLPIYDNIKIVKEYKMDLDDHKVFIEAPFARPELKINRKDLLDKNIKSITYLYSYNNNHPEFAQSRLSDKRYENLVKALSAYNLTDVKWETLAQAGCGEIPCSEDLYHGFVIEFEDPAEFLGDHLLETQSFTVDNNVASTVTGKDGTKLEIPANAFVDAFGNPVEGEVDVYLKEAVTTEDIVLGGLYTVTEDGAILQSKGMIEIRVSQGNQELELNGEAEIKVELPTTYEEGYQYFEGINEHGELVWTNPQEMDNEETDGNSVESDFNTYYNEVTENPKDNSDRINSTNGEGTFFDVVSSKEMMDFFPVKANYQEGSLTSVLVMNYGKRHLIFPRNANYSNLQLKGFTEDQTDMIITWFEQDTVVHEKLQWNKENKILLTEERNSRHTTGSLSNNIFSMKKTGWANCDKFTRFKDTQPTVASLGEDFGFTGVQMSLVMPGANVLMSGYEKMDGTFFFPAAPVGKNAVLIATGSKGGNKYCAIKEFKIGELEVHELEPVESTEEEITTMIKKKI